ncbi:exosporium protein D [Bacillus cereus group sp. BfR-BA-01400]|uniref:exosporium protein D n=1 Tax=Bacillus cereus group sp. BfR-BA-01400 TaxID=2920334 RepID=UPI001F565723
MTNYHFNDKKNCYEKQTDTCLKNQKKECFISTNTVAGSGNFQSGNIPLDFLLNAGEANVLLYQNYTNNHSNSLIQLSVPFNTTPAGPLLVTINTRNSPQEITDSINQGQTRLYEVEDFESLIVSNDNNTESTFFTLFIQNTFCICCSD